MSKQTVTFKHNATFKGAKSGKPYQIEGGKPVEVDIDELSHLSEDDYVIGEAETEVPAGPGKKKRNNLATTDTIESSGL
jgi:hypothetical protein